MSKATARSCRRHKWRTVLKPWTAKQKMASDCQEVEQCAYCGVERVATTKGNVK